MNHLVNHLVNRLVPEWNFWPETHDAAVVAIVAIKAIIAIMGKCLSILGLPTKTGDQAARNKNTIHNN